MISSLFEKEHFDFEQLKAVSYTHLDVYKRQVSDRPLRAPCAEIKYSSTSRPSRKLDLIGNSIVRPDAVSYTHLDVYKRQGQ